MDSERLLPLGQVVGVHGLKGGLKIRHDCQSGELLRPGNRLYVRLARGPARAYEIRAFQPMARGAVLFLAGVADRPAATALVGSEIEVMRSSLPAIREEGTYYWADLIGLAVVNDRQQPLGRLTAIMPTGGNDVYVVRDEASGREWLLPALASVVLAVDLQAGRMTVALPEGLE